jgi:hypothetical protein
MVSLNVINYMDTAVEWPGPSHYLAHQAISYDYHFKFI